MSNVATDVWAAHDKYPKQEVECQNGHFFRSHSRFDGSRVRIVSREACPICGSDELVAARDTQRELQTISSDDVLREAGRPFDANAMALIARLGLSWQMVHNALLNLDAWMIEEVQKRIIHMPFDGPLVLLRRPGSMGFDVVHHIMNRSGEVRMVNGYDQVRDPKAVVIVPDCAALTTQPIKARGQELQPWQMPLYLDSGDHEFAHVYPIFDWYNEQLAAYVIKYIVKGLL